MRLISQDGTIDVPYDNTIIYRNDEYIICVFGCTDKERVLARYSTYEKAKKAIETRWAKEKSTQEYERIQTNTEHTNNNSNSNTIPISIPKAISINGGGMEGAEQQAEKCLVSSLDGPEKIDFEKERSRKLAEFAKWANKQEKA